MKKQSIKSQIKTVVEKERGCGFRKQGAMYIRCDGAGRSCGRLPAPIVPCECCGHTIPHKIGFMWVKPKPVLAGRQCEAQADQCATCPMSPVNLPERAGLIWIGGLYYPTPAEFNKEAAEMGISRRIHNVPKGFKVGESWILLAHKKAIESPCEACQGNGVVNPVQKEKDELLIVPVKCPDCDGSGKRHAPGIFHAFRPDRIEYVVRPKDSAKKLQAFVDKGIVLVKVVKDEQKPLKEAA